MERPIWILALVSILVGGLTGCRSSSILITPNSQLFTSEPTKIETQSNISAILPTRQSETPIAPLDTPGPVDSTSSSGSCNPASDYLSLQDKLEQLYEKASPGVVSIRVITTNGGSLGSGFVYDKEGHIVTNYHVIENQADLEVIFLSGKRTRGWVSATDQDSDLAVIRVDVPGSELQPLDLGTAAYTKVGQMVVAIGNPFGLQGTMTTGIISGKGRTLNSQRTGAGGSVFTAGDLIQTDAAINPGNSGGPLLNLEGEVIGVNESILTSGYEQTGSGVAFAISIDTVKRIVPDLIEKGEFNYPYLGIFSLGEITLLAQEVLGLPRTTGVYVTSVALDSPADRAGIQAGIEATNLPGVPSGGDLIIAIDGNDVYNFNDLIVFITMNKRPGDIVVLTILRGDEQIDLELTLDERLK